MDIPHTANNTPARTAPNPPVWSGRKRVAGCTWRSHGLRLIEPNDATQRCPAHTSDACHRTAIGSHSQKHAYKVPLSRRASGDAEKGVASLMNNPKPLLVESTLFTMSLSWSVHQPLPHGRMPVHRGSSEQLLPGIDQACDKRSCGLSSLMRPSRLGGPVDV
jgi:hypothetical protein